MASRGYNGRLIYLLKQDHKNYALLQFGNEFQVAPKCIYEMNLDNWIEDAEEKDVYSQWWNFELV